MKALAAALLLAGVPAAAVPVQTPPAAPAAPSDDPQPDEMPGAAAFGRASTMGNDAARLAALDEALTKLPRPTRFRGYVQCARAEVLGRLERVPDAGQAAEECRRLRPEDARGLWLLASLELTRDPRRGARLLVAALRVDPRPVVFLDRDFMASIFRQLDYLAETRTLRSELLRALADAGWQREDPGALSAQALYSARALAAAGDTKAAIALLPLILSSQQALEVLIDRRFAPIWTDAEAWAGSTLETQRRAYVDAARAAFDVDPGFQRRSDYAEALVDAGRGEEAVPILRAGLADRTTTDEGAYFHASMASRIGALLADLGRGEEGLAAIRAAKAAIPADAINRPNVMPNEARLLIRLGRGDDALALLDRETPAAAKVESPAALGYFAALRVCAHKTAGRVAVAHTQLAIVRLRYPTNIDAIGMAVRCAGTVEERRAYWLARLDDEERRGAALVAWARAGRASAATSTDEAVRDLAGLRADPVLRPRMEALGRALPESFGPALDGWRTPAG